MAVTYSGDPANSDLDAVRFLIGDTSTSAGLLQDAEIEWLVDTQGNVYKAAAQAARTIYARYAGEAQSKTVGPLSISFGGTAKNYLDLAKALENEWASGSVMAIAVYSGGISKADKALVSADEDYDKPWFFRGIHDYPGTSSESIVSPST